MQILKAVKRLFASTPALSPEIEQRLKAWEALPPPDLTRTFAESEFIVVDVETSGFSLRKDNLIAIGACLLKNAKIPLANAFDIILRQEQISSKQNILIHHISQEQQLNGVEPAEALMRFLEYMGKRPLLAFYVGFDQPMLDKAFKKYLGISLKHHIWLDVAFIAPLFFPEKARQHRNLDFWMKLFHIQNMNRHHAVADAVATAQVMQAVMKAAPINLNLQKLKDMQAKAMKIHNELHGPK
ncbi:3'-5' exonuclease [Pelistega europaea]|uniref:3'-5' exonuclease n=1 Tax=Pelistega europaea TaxID=106147 RepID=A0A7Y4LAV1_9BURK|nr:3'-5' exonuclease [Pelistega europaea]NOL50200.1 3'-5' exonuclease [Pelistega europaea]